MLVPESQVEDLEDTVVITVTFPGRTAAKCDLVVADLYAKFNLSPYFLQVDFPERVARQNVVASAKVNVLTIRIKKEVAQKWPPPPWTFEKEALRDRREASYNRLIEEERQREEDARIAREAAEKEAMQKAWDVEKQQRQALKDAQEAEKKYAGSLLTGESSGKELKDMPLYEPVQFAPSRAKQEVTVVHTPTMKDVPARYSGPDRNFIVPKKGDASPVWMKQQGDVFFKNGDYKSAINAYTEAVDGSDRQYCAAFSNRAAARLKLGMTKLALNDCVEGLALIADPILTPEVAKMKMRLLSRKTQALFLEKRYIEAYESCTEILKWLRDDVDVKADVDLLIRLAGHKMKEEKEIAETLHTIEGKSQPKTDVPDHE
jgi:tetratricopeptide (TPR) repeat protein